jgi:hypothetical protein
MVLARSILAFTLVASACTVARAAKPSGPAKPVSRRIAGPTTPSPQGIEASLIVFATPRGHASVRRVLTHLL